MRAKYIGCIGTQAHGRQVTSLLCQSDVIIRCCIQELLGPFLKNKMWYLMVSKKRIHYSRESRIEKSVPRDCRLSSLGKPRDAKW